MNTNQPVSRLLALTCRVPAKRFGAVLSGLLLGSTLQASTVTLCNENFDSFPGAVTSFTNTSVAVPISDYIRIEDGVAYQGSPYAVGFNGVQLVTGWIPSSPYNSGNAMLLRDNTAFRFNVDPRGGTNVTWEFSMLSSKSGTADRGFRMSILEEGADQNEQDSVIFRSGQAATASNTTQPGGIGVDGVDIIQAFNGFNTASGVPLPNQWVTVTNAAAGMAVFITNNVWAHYKVVLDAATRKFSFYVNDMVTPVAVQVAAARPQNLPITSIRFAHEGNSADDGYTLIDNVKLTVDGDFISLANGAYSDGFEAYAASTSATIGTADSNPGGAWVTCETSTPGANAALTNTRVQVVDSSVTAPHSGSKCLMVSQAQTAGVSLSWGQATNEDVKITWWAKVPGVTNAGTLNPDAVWLRVSLYGWEADYSSASDTMLFGYGHRAAGFRASPNNWSGTTNSIITFSRWFNEWFNNGSWNDTYQTYTPDTWEEYQVVTDMKRNGYTLVKNPSTTPVVIVKDGKLISSWGNNKKIHTIGFSTSNTSTPGSSPAAYVDDITIQPYTNTNDPEPRAYSPNLVSARFTNYTVLTIPGKTVGGVTVDPRDNSILFTIDEERIGQVMHATKVANGNWAVDPTPVVSGLYNPNACAVGTNGTLWVVRDNAKGGQGGALMRLKQPWASSQLEEVISDFGSSPTNLPDQPCDLAFFNQGGATKLAVLDRGVDGNNAPNAIWVVDPADTNLNQVVYNQGGVNQLVGPSTTLFGAGLTGNANGIAFLPATGELATIWEGDGVNDNGVIQAFDATTGSPRSIFIGPGSGVTWGAGVATDPTTGRLWVTDRKNTVIPSAFATPQIVSIDAASGASTQEITFTNNAPSLERPDKHVDFKDPGIAFSTNGNFLVVSDQSLVAAGGRLFIFHNETFTIPSINITNVTRSASSASLSWTTGGAVNYVVQRATVVNGPYTTISGSLTGTSFTDAAPPAGNAFYRVQATAQN